MYRIGKRFSFEASHMLTGLTEGHPCMRMHGHSYIVEIELQGETLSTEGWVRDYGDLKRIKGDIDERLDHRHLNSVIPQPTAEHLAKYLFSQWRDWYPELASVTVRETANTYATYAPCRGVI